jgi:hypothetical protein
MTGLLMSGTGRRAATSAAPRVLTTPRWRTMQRVLTLLVAGSAAVVGIQLGITGPLTSPVQPAGTAAGAPAAAGQDQAQDPAGNDRRAGFGRGPGNGGGGGGRR